jgi:hypothetical protein
MSMLYEEKMDKIHNLYIVAVQYILLGKFT